MAVEYVVLTVDTEEDGWDTYRDRRGSVSNVARIDRVQRLCDRYGARPTYLITYPVAADGKAASQLREIASDGRCEIGAHLHPWSTPPFEETPTAMNSMLCNLPTDLQRRKIAALHAMIRRNLDVEPVSFRCGRWGLGSSIPRLIHEAGYRVDSSVTPFVDWRANHGPDYSDVGPDLFRFRIGGDGVPGRSDDMLEVPATIGFVHGDFRQAGRWRRRLAGSPLGTLGLLGLLSRVNLLNRVWLSPEVSDSREMIRLAEAVERNDCPVLNMFFHSNSLKAGLNPFVRSQADEEALLRRIETFLSYAKGKGWRPVRLSDLTVLQARPRLRGETAA